MGVVAPPSLWVFKNRLEKHSSGMIAVELLLPWGTEMAWVTSCGPFQPCFLWCLILDFSLLIPRSPRGAKTITLHFYPYKVSFAGRFLLILVDWFNYICHMILLSCSLFYFFFSASPLGLSLCLLNRSCSLPNFLKTKLAQNLDLFCGFKISN